MKSFVAVLLLMISTGGLATRDHGNSTAELESLRTPMFVNGRIAAFIGPCVDDIYCGGGEHHMEEGGDQFQEDYHSCMEPEMHHGPGCAVTFHPNEVLTAGATRLAAMLTAPETNVSLNIERNAIQVRGCTGSIIAHLPLRTGAMAEILSDL